MREPEPHRVALAASWLTQQLACAFGWRAISRSIVDVRVVGGVAFDEDQLGAATHLGRALEDGAMLPASLRAGTMTDTQRFAARSPRACGARSSDDEVGERRLVERPHASQIRDWRASRVPPHAHGQQDLVPVARDFEVGQAQQVVDVVDGEPVLLEQRRGQPERARQVERDLPEAAVEVQDQPRAGPA